MEKSILGVPREGELLVPEVDGRGEEEGSEQGLVRSGLFREWFSLFREWFSLFQARLVKESCSCRKWKATESTTTSRTREERPASKRG